MTRMIVFTIGTAALLLLAPNAVPDAAAQQTQIRVELDQALLDRWLAIAPGLIRQSKSMQADPASIDAYFPRWRQMCSDAGFETFEQCQDVTAYVGMIIGACDRNTRSFRDPVDLMRRQLAQLEADTAMTSVEREQQIGQLKAVLEVLPKRLPREHLELMTANRDRIFKAIAAAEE